MSLTKKVSQFSYKQKRFYLVRLLAFFLLSIFFSACSSSAGVLSGGNWQQSGLAHLQVQSLAAQSGTPTTLYAATNQGNIFVSTDSGQHWSEHSSGLPLPDPVYKLSTNLNGQKVYAATEKGLFVSSGSVNSWTVVSGLPTDRYTALDFSVRNLNTIYVGTGLHGVLVSTDSGSSWTQAGSGGLPVTESVNDLAVDADVGHVWSVEASGVYRLDSQKNRWQSLSTGLPSGIAINTVLPAGLAGGPANLVYLGTNRGFFLSEDAGAHWKRGAVPLSGTSVHTILIDSRNTDTKTLYLATDAGALQSIDSGQDWGLLAKGLPANQPVKTLVLGGDNYAQIYAVADAIYLYPGTSSGLTPGRIVPLVLLAVFFFLLVSLSQRSRRRRRRSADQTSLASSS